MPWFRPSSWFRPSPTSRYGPALIDHLPVGIAVYSLEDPADDASLRLVYANAAGAAMTGVDLPGDVGRRFAEIVPASAGTPRMAAYAAVARGGDAQALGDVPYGDDRMAARTYRVDAVPLPGRAVGIVFVDVSEEAENAGLRHDRTALARGEARYRTLVEATAAIVWASSPDGRFTEPQPGWSDFTGMTTDELMGDGYAAAVHPDDRRRAYEVWSEAVRSGTPYVHTHRVRRADGTYRTMHVHATPVRGDDGRIAEWVGVHTDAEDQSEAAAALAASETRFRTLFDALADPVLVYPLGPDGPEPLVAFNAATVARYGYTEAELDGMTIDALLAPGGGETSETALDTLRRTRQASFDSTHLTKDGRTLPVQTSARLIEYEGRLCVLALARDDAERRAFQRDLSRANLSLERTVAARTEELQAFADALKILHRITTEDYATPEQRTDAYLHAGCTMFSMPVGILSATPIDEATGERMYRIESVVSPDPSLEPGLTVPIREAFCDAVLEREETVAYGDAAVEEGTGCHPAYATRGLRAFIGTPIWVEDEIIGTLNFVSPEVRPGGFRAFERDLVEIMADAIARRIVADRAESERRRLEEWSLRVVETVSDGIILVAPDGSILFSNPSARELLGLDKRRDHTDDMPARWPVIDEAGDPIHGDDLPEREVLRTKEPVRGMIQGICPPGEPTRWYRVNATPVDHDADGRTDAVVVSFADVTELRAATEEARRGAALLASVQAATPEGVMAFRACRDAAGAIEDFEFLLANPRSLEITAQTGQTLIGRRLLAVFPGNVETGLFDAYRRVTDTGETFQSVTDYPDDGVAARLQITAVPLDIGGDGSPDGFVVVFTAVAGVS